MVRVIAIFIIAASLAACGANRNSARPSGSVQVGSIALRVQSGGSALPLFEHEGNWYLLGEEGLKYEICLLNTSQVEVETVVSVDGRDVVSGRAADYRKDRGYVLMPNEEVCIEGFRQSMEEVAAFEFSPRSESYAARMGDDANVGVIGVAVFDEAPEPRPVAIAADGDDRSDEHEAGAAPRPEAAEGPAVAKSDEARGIGTEYGESVSSEAQIVPFRRRNPLEPFEIISVFYDNREGLESAGIRVPKDTYLPPVRRSPNPFPGASGDASFAPPPPAE